MVGTITHDPLGWRTEHRFDQAMFVNVGGFKYRHIAPIAQNGGAVANTHHLGQPVSDQYG